MAEKGIELYFSAKEQQAKTLLLSENCTSHVTPSRRTDLMLAEDF